MKQTVVTAIYGRQDPPDTESAEEQLNDAARLEGSGSEAVLETRSGESGEDRDGLYCTSLVGAGRLGRTRVVRPMLGERKRQLRCRCIEVEWSTSLRRIAPC